jgi:carboxypeptidase family protein
MPLRAALTLLLLVPLCILPSGKSWAAEIVGRISDSQTGRGIQKAVVRVVPQQPVRRDSQVETNEAGEYHLELVRGKYKLFVSVPGSNYIPQFYSASGQEQGDTIDVPTFHSFTIINIPLSAGGSIEGNVRRWTDNEPVGNVRVYAESSTRRVSANTNQDGRYIFRGLLPDTYKIRVITLDENYVTVYFDDALNWDQAESIILGRHQEVTGINFRLRYGGMISGRVYARKNRDPIPSLKIIAEKQSSKEPPFFTYTDPQGFYVLRGLTDGRYTVESSILKDFDSQIVRKKRYLTQYYDGRFDRELASKLKVESGSNITGVDFALVQGGRISGTVRSHHHNLPLEDVEILPQPTNKEFSTYPRARTNAAGEFLIQDLPPGEYILDTHLPKQSQRFVKVFYQDKLNSERADKIVLEEDGWVRNIDFNLGLGAVLKGQFKVDEPDYRFNPEGSAIKLKRVGLDLEGYGERQFELNSDGSFTVEGIPPGRYSLNPKVLDPNVLVRQNPEGKILEMSEGELIEGIEFPLKVGGSISGIVSSQSDFYTLDKLLLILISIKENTQTYFDVSSEQYTLAGIDPGKYVMVLLTNPEKTHPTENFRPTRVFDTRVVEVLRGKTTRGVDFQIARSAENQPGVLR